VKLVASGTERAETPLAQFRCVECGYGASRAAAPERCPMCGETVWEHEPWRPFSKRMSPPEQFLHDAGSDARSG
jgi:hypothetical protein